MRSRRRLAPSSTWMTERVVLITTGALSLFMKRPGLSPLTLGIATHPYRHMITQVYMNAPNSVCEYTSTPTFEFVRNSRGHTSTQTPHQCSCRERHLPPSTPHQACTRSCSPGADERFKAKRDRALLAPPLAASVPLSSSQLCCCSCPSPSLLSPSAPLTSKPQRISPILNAKSAPPADES